MCAAVGLAAGAQLELDQGDMGGEREVAEVRVVEGAREEARRLGLRQPQPQPLHGHLGEAGEALRLRIAVGHEVRGGARVLQADLEHDVLALQLIGARHQPQLDAEAREQNVGGEVLCQVF